MKYNFSNKINQLKPSAIREILKATSDPNIISFAAGNPSPDAFPIKEIREISDYILSECPINTLQYGLTEGYGPLKEILKARLNDNMNIHSSDDDLLVVSGAQQAIDLIGRCFLDEDDIVLCENPSFIGALNSLKANGGRLIGIPLESDGIDPDQLEQMIIMNHKVKLLYIIPNFQNPTGITTSLEKRKTIYDICVKYGVIIIEDDPYGDLRFKGDPIPSIKSLDMQGIVIYCGSLSKVLAPGIRIGFISANKEILNRLVVAKQSSDVHSNMWAQIVCHEYMTKYNFDNHIKKLCELYKNKCNLMTSLIDEHFSEKVSRTNPEGGLFIWCTTPHDSNAVEFCKKAINHNVAVVPGTAFLPYELMGITTSFRLNYSTPTDDEIKKGIKILGELTKSL